MQAKNYDIDTSDMSIRQLKSFFGTALKAANDRIKTLTKEQYVERAQAYKYHVEPLRGAGYIKTRTDKASGREMTVFTQPKAPGKNASKAEQKRYAAQLREAVTNVKRFLSARTSTVSGIKSLESERRDRLDEMMNAVRRQKDGQKHSEGTGLSKDEKDSILRWMGSPDGKSAMEQFDSHQVREAVTTAVIANRAGKGKKSVVDLYSEFQKTQKTFADWIYQNQQTLSSMGKL